MVGGGFNLPMQLGLGHLCAHCQPPRSLQNPQSLQCSSLLWLLQPSVLLLSSGCLWFAGTSCSAGKAATNRNRTQRFVHIAPVPERNDLVMTAKCLPPWNKCKTIVMIQLQLLF